jgi:alkanesulfonate monooxygenase SsuD/methylene tetrahydromethanopterin reductase-like flavin-dependent oxidoreductase (luciferase family)
MHFGQFNLMGYRERGTPTRQILDEAIEQVKAADQAGFEIAWFAEHHFSNYCVCPSPLMMVAACAKVTQRIKLGPAVVVIPLYEPVRLLAEIGMADSLCDGRLALGIGSGYQPYEFERFGVDLTKSKEMLLEFMDMYELAFAQETFSYQGKQYQLQESHISARLTQQRPDIWLAGDAHDIHRIAARRGYIPMFTGRLFGAGYLEEMRGRIEQAWHAEGKDPQAMPLGIQRFMCVTANRKETLEYAENARHQMRLASNLRRRAEVVDGSMLIEQPIPDELPLEQIADNLLVGDCETIAERLSEELRRARPSHVMFHFQVGASDFRKAMQTIELFASTIRPLVERELGPLDQFGRIAA